MERAEVERRLSEALLEVVTNDRHLFETNANERAIAARLAMSLQRRFHELTVDSDYNRDGYVAKRLEGLPPECAKYRNENDQSLAVPDVIVHRRGREGPNVLVLELKKTTNPDRGDCDRHRLRPFRDQFHYEHAALILCETRERRAPSMVIVDWF